MEMAGNAGIALLAEPSAALAGRRCVRQVLINAKVVWRGEKRLPPGRDSSANRLRFLKSSPGGGIAHIRDSQMRGLSRRVSALGCGEEVGEHPRALRL